MLNAKLNDIIQQKKYMETEGDIVAKKYERRKKEKMAVIAICYDFDKTLSPDDMQAQG